MKRSYRSLLAGLLLGATVLTGCSQVKSNSMSGYIDTVEISAVEILDEAVALADLPKAAVSTLLTPSAPGKQQKKTAKAVIDYSNAADGYVMVQFTEKTSKKLKAQVKGPTTTYTYNITPAQWEVFPLSDGNGTYQVGVFENVSGTSYTNAAAASFQVTLKDEFSAFLYPNQYVNYTPAVNSVAKAAELTKGITDPLKKVEAVYNFVVKTLAYDKEFAKTVQSGYLPELDKTLSNKKGICFDYASLMTGMLRSQGIPCKLVIGYAGTAYHAWINVWTSQSGWVDGAIYFDGTAWHRMDPTFASSSNKSQSVMSFIGDGKNYTVKYLY